MTRAFESYVGEVKAGHFPDPDHSYPDD